jgi:hypothetical protein
MRLDENEAGDYYYTEDETFDYFANICGSTSMLCGGGANGRTVAIQKNKFGVCVATLAKSYNDINEAHLIANKTDGDLYISFKDGDPCGENDDPR